MFDIGFSEVLLISVIALVVLGPEKLPRVASQLGRWVGRARAMARQFREQLEEEVNLEEVRKAQGAKPQKPAAEPTAQPADQAGGGPVHSAAAAQEQPVDPSQPQESPFSTVPDPMDLRADTFSHAHPTNEYGANPLTPNGAPPEAQVPPAQQQVAASTPLASAPEAIVSQAEAPTEGPKVTGGERHSSNTPSTVTPDAEGSVAAAAGIKTSPLEKPEAQEREHL
jgi:sec-independent protein translocase protein TatB